MAMNKQRKSSNLINILSYDDAGNIVLRDYSQTIRYNWNGTIHAFTGPLSISSIAAAVTDTDRFLVSDGGVLKYRTGAEVLSDIGGVPSTRTLTINGTTFDLSADRSWTITAGITGSGVANQVTYWNGTGSVTGSSGLTYTDSTGSLGLTKNQNAATALTIANGTNGTAATTQITFSTDLGISASISKVSASYTPYKILGAGGLNFFSTGSGDINFLNDFTNGRIRFAAGQSSTAQMTLTAAGRLLLGTTTEGTYIFDVVGSDARINGVRIGKGNNNQSNNTSVGENALNAITSGQQHTAIGSGALQAQTTSFSSVAIGYLAGNSVTTSGFNTIVGTEAMRFGNGANNTIIGSASGFTNSGSNNTFVGNSVGKNISGSFNIGLGSTNFSSASGNSGTYNIAIGQDIMTGVITGTNNTAIQYASLQSITSGSWNVSFGYQAGFNLTTGSNNTFIGTKSGMGLTTTSFNTFIGSLFNTATGNGITTGSYNTIIGSQVSGLSSSLANNIILADGQGNMRLVIDNNGNSYFGATTSYPTINASAKVQIDSTTQGFLPPRMTTVQRDAIASPATGLSVYNTTTNTNDFYNGTAWSSLAAGNIYTTNGTLTGNRTVTMGSFTLSFEKDVLVNGLTIGKGNNQDITNTAIGVSALAVSTAINNTAFGYAALQSNTTGIQNTALGRAAGANNVTGIQNVFIGLNAGLLSRGSGNTLIGTAVATNLTTGGNNIFIGYQAGFDIITGSQNTIIGNFIFADVLPSTTSNNIILADGGGNIRIRAFNTGNVTIGGSTDAGFKLDVQGSLSVRMPSYNSVGFRLLNADGVADWQFYNNGNNPTNGRPILEVPRWSTGTPIVIGTGNSSGAVGAIGIGNGNGLSNSAIAIGNHNGTFVGLGSIAIGTFINNSGTRSTQIGSYSGNFGNALRIANDDCFAIGNAFQYFTTANAQGILNAVDIYIGRPARSTSGSGDVFNGTATTINGNGGYGLANATGGNLTINGGVGLGSGTSGDVIIGTATPTTTGTTLQSLTNRVWIKGDTGNMLIASGTDLGDGAKLQVNGGTRINHLYTHTTGVYTSGLFSFTSVTTPTSPSYTSGMSYGAGESYYRNEFQGSATIPNSVIQSAQFNASQIRFVNSSTAITMTQGGSGIRAYASEILQFSFDNAQASCSVSHVAGMQILAPYYQGANNPTITNLYGIVLNDSAEYSATLSVTNRWAIYQDGASDNNYFKGKVVIGSTNTVGSSRLNVKDLPTSATGLSTGDVWNNGGVLNIV